MYRAIVNKRDLNQLIADNAFKPEIKPGGGGQTVEMDITEEESRAYFKYKGKDVYVREFIIHKPADTGYIQVQDESINSYEKVVRTDIYMDFADDWSDYNAVIPDMNSSMTVDIKNSYIALTLSTGYSAWARDFRVIIYYTKK